MNKKEVFQIAKGATKEFFTGNNVGRAIDVAEKGVEAASGLVTWLKIAAGLALFGVLIGVVAIITSVVL